MVWSTAELMVRALFEAGHSAVILDATNLTRKARDGWRSDEWATVFDHVDTCVETCLERACVGGQHYLIPVIERMASSIEPLGDDENAYS